MNAVMKLPWIIVGVKIRIENSLLICGFSKLLGPSHTGHSCLKAYLLKPLWVQQ